MDKEGVMGRPIGSTGKQYNSLDVFTIRKLVAEYSTTSNNDLMKIYNISRTQLRDIVKQYKLKSKYIGKYTSQKRDISFFTDKCGIYAIVRNDQKKVYIGSSSNIGCRLKTHLSELNHSNHNNTELQKDWGTFGFYLAMIEECNEVDLLKRENEILDSIDSGYLYNTKEFSYMVSQTCKNKLCCNPEHLINVSSKESSRLSIPRLTFIPQNRSSKLDPFKEMILAEREKGKKWKEIQAILPIKINDATICRYAKKWKLRQGG